MQSIETTAKDFGIHGQIFEIEEEDMLELINSRLNRMEKGGFLASKRQEMESRTRKFVRRPTPVKNITSTRESKMWEFDPTYIAPKDIKDHQGRVICMAGDAINPLETQSLKPVLFFIDGDDQSQINWTLKMIKNLEQEYRIILVNGAPMELMIKHKVRFYFDQHAIQTKRFGITQIPAIVKQKGLKLQVEEVVLGK